ncbi:MAG TPA: hypothetical protein VIL84_02895 [Devosiaceae bacterium]
MDTQTRPRVALSIYDRLEPLQLAAARLAAAGVVMTEMVLVAEAGLLRDDVRRYTMQPGSEAHPNLVLHDTAGNGLAETSSPLAANFERWTPPEVSSGLSRHLQSGDLLLVVPLAGTEQERQVSEILLETSIDQVQIHDVGQVAPLA